MAKNFLLTSEQKLERKLKEAILAIRIERAYSKDKILELYLNEIYLGIGSYGVAGGRLNYFSKELSELIDRGGGLSRRPAEGAQQLSSVPQDARSHRPAQLDHRSDGRGWLHHAASSRKRPRPSRSTVNIRPFGTQIYAADYFAEEVRRRLMDMCRRGWPVRPRRAHQPSATARVNGGLSVRTTLDPEPAAHGPQGPDRRVCVAFDRDKGWRGAVQKIEIGRRLGRDAGRASKVPTTWHPGGSASCSTRSAAKAVDRAAPSPPGRRHPRGRARGRWRSPSRR